MGCLVKRRGTRSLVKAWCLIKYHVDILTSQWLKRLLSLSHLTVALVFIACKRSISRKRTSRCETVDNPSPSAWPLTSHSPSLWQHYLHYIVVSTSSVRVELALLTPQNLRTCKYLAGSDRSASPYNFFFPFSWRKHARIIRIYINKQLTGLHGNWSRLL